MAKCHICGQSTDSGSVCRHCRAALNRLRERAAPPGDGHGSLALAGAAVGGGASSAAATGNASGFLRRRKDAVAAAPAARIAATAESPSGTRSKPWVPIVAMAVLVAVGGIAVYQLVDSGSAPASLPSVARPVEPTPTPPPVRVLEAPPPQPAVAPPMVVLEPPQPAVAPAPTVSSRRTTERAPADTEASRASDAARASRAAPSPQPAAKAAAPAAPAAPSVPASTATPMPPALPAALPARGRWDRMDAALEECSRREFLNRLICREKVRMEYCEGQWGKIDRCPGTPAIEHGS